MEINPYVCDQLNLIQVAIDIWHGLTKIHMALIVKEKMEPNKKLSDKIGNDRERKLSSSTLFSSLLLFPSPSPSSLTIVSYFFLLIPPFGIPYYSLYLPLLYFESKLMKGHQ